MPVRGNEEKYGSLARTFHWLVVLLVIGLVAGGNIIVNLEYTDPLRAMITKVHRTVGLTLFILMLSRLLWAFFDVRPPPLATLKKWELVLSKIVHYSFYLLLMTLPVLGFLFSGASVDRVPFAGFTLPSAMPFTREASDMLIGAHRWISRLVGFLALLHVAGVLKHHFIDDTPMWRRMI